MSRREFSPDHYEFLTDKRQYTDPEAVRLVAWCRENLRDTVGIVVETLFQLRYSFPVFARIMDQYRYNPDDDAVKNMHLTLSFRSREDAALFRLTWAE